MIGAVQSKNLPVEPEPSRRFNLLFTVEGSGIQGMEKVEVACAHVCINMYIEPPRGGHFP